MALDPVKAQALLQDIVDKSKAVDDAKTAQTAADAAAVVADAASVTAESARKASLATIEAFLESDGATPTAPTTTTAPAA